MGFAENRFAPDPSPSGLIASRGKADAWIPLKTARNRSGKKNIAFPLIYGILTSMQRSCAHCPSPGGSSWTGPRQSLTSIPSPRWRVSPTLPCPTTLHFWQNCLAQRAAESAEKKGIIIVFSALSSALREFRAWAFRLRLPALRLALLRPSPGHSDQIPVNPGQSQSIPVNPSQSQSIRPNPT